MLHAQEVKAVASASDSIVGVLVNRDLHAAKHWWRGWLAGYSAATVGQGIIAAKSSDLSTRQDMYLGAATTLVGAAGQLVSPLKPRFMNKKTFAPNCSDSLKILAYAENSGRSWQMHAGACAVNLCSGLVTWLGFKRTLKDGLINFALNTAVTEAQIWMQPVKARNFYLKSNRASSQAAIDRFPAGKYTVSFVFAPGAAGVLIRF